MGNQATKYAPITKARELPRSGQFIQITVFLVRPRQLKETLYTFQSSFNCERPQYETAASECHLTWHVTGWIARKGPTKLSMMTKLNFHRNQVCSDKSFLSAVLFLRPRGNAKPQALSSQTLPRGLTPAAPPAWPSWESVCSKEETATEHTWGALDSWKWNRRKPSLTTETRAADTEVWGENQVSTNHLFCAVSLESFQPGPTTKVSSCSASSEWIQAKGAEFPLDSCSGSKSKPREHGWQSHFQIQSVL